LRPPRPPELEPRRTAEFSAELRERAQAWITDWELSDGEQDFGRALLEIAARFNSEVAERLNRVGEKMQKGFLDWLAVRGKAARPARVPIVFAMAEAAQEALLASAPVRLQADANGVPVVFETEQDVRIVPGRVAAVVAVDAEQDAYYTPPPGLSDLKPLEPLPTQWTLKSFASQGSDILQLEPAAGLSQGLIINAGEKHYKITKVDGNLVTVEPKLDASLTTDGGVLSKVTSISPFEGIARNQQEHALYIGDEELLNIESDATIEVIGAQGLKAEVRWEYWGKSEKNEDVPDWQEFIPNDATSNASSDRIVLTKRKGSIESLDFHGWKARWIRAYSKTVAAVDKPFQRDQLSLSITSGSGKNGGANCPYVAKKESVAKDDGLAFEAMVNTTPLALTDKFWPLGQEPKQFDAFYLACDEAFSKSGAEVQLCFEMVEPRFNVLSCLRVAPHANTLLAGIGADRFLHLMDFDSSNGTISPRGVPVRPPSPGDMGATVEAAPNLLDFDRRYRSPMWVISRNVYVGVVSENSVWVWRESTPSEQSGWESAGILGPDGARIDGLAYLADGTKGRLFALQDEQLFVRNLSDASPTWDLVKREDGNPELKLKSIAPIGSSGVDIGSGVLAEGLIAVDDLNDLYAVTFSSAPFEATYHQLMYRVDPEVIPAAVRRKDRDNRLVVLAAEAALPGQPRKMLASLSKPGNFDRDDFKVLPLEALHQIETGALDVNLNGSVLAFVFRTNIGDEHSFLAACAPFESTTPSTVATAPVPPRLGSSNGTPTVLANHVILPTTSSQLIVASFNIEMRLAKRAPMKSVVITPEAAGSAPAKVKVYFPDTTGSGAKYDVAESANAGVAYRGHVYYGFNRVPKDRPIFAFRADVAPFVGRVGGTLDTMRLGESTTDEKTKLLITTDTSTQLYEVLSVTTAVPRIATLDRPLDHSTPAVPLEYWIANENTAQWRARLIPDTADVNSGNWDAALLEQALLSFPEADPNLQYGVAFERDESTPPPRPKQISLEKSWRVPPPVVSGKVAFVVEAAFGNWNIQLGDSFSNPELLWEYWDGRAWSLLNPHDDQTKNLRNTATVTFDVPPDIAAVDWSGKIHHWIRARLTGGDYGRDKVVVKIKTISDGSEQTVLRVPDGIRAPEIIKLRITYKAKRAVLPKYVLSQDSGTIRDQSEANRTKGAIVEAFVPLAVMLSRLAQPAAESSEGGHLTQTEPSRCGCDQSKASNEQKKPAPAEPELSCPEEAAGGAGRQLFVGFSACPTGEPVNLFVFVDREQHHDAYTPMTIETLATNRFVPLVVTDTTRALGESGVISLSFATSPTQHSLFGNSALFWVRLLPLKDDSGWQPSLRGVYLNAVWASATETLTRELLGSSEGEPELTVRLARPPVLQDSLELRVREPLGDEERKVLLDEDLDSVKSDVESLPGDWVLWRQVADPGDTAASERVYALDEATGEIRFGDGRHGMIPPIGRDAIVAFRYCRTEPDPAGGDSVPANRIAPRAALNLVTPLASVESAVTADQAAGGSPPESASRVLRFGYSRLRHRERLLTASDLEDLALESSPDIAQARALVGRGRTRLIVVMRGENPFPNAVQKRELHRLLIAAGPASLSRPDALEIKAPRSRRLRVELNLCVETLDHAGAVAETVKRRLAMYFNAATGGADQSGWPLGAEPTEDDIALALLDTPYLESIGDIARYQVTDDGRIRPWFGQMKADEIALLAKDPVKINFVSAEAIA
jgi:hypothetical protein